MLLDLHDHGEDHGVALGVFEEELAQVVFDGGLDGGPVGDPSGLTDLQGVGGDHAQGFHEILVVLHIHEAAADDVGAGEDGAVLAGQVHADHDHAVLGQMLAVPQHHAAHVAYASAVHQDLAGGDGACQLAGLGGTFDDPTDVGDQDVLGVHAHLTGDGGVLLQVALFAVEGDEETGLHQGVDDLQLLLTGVAGDMESLQLVVDHVRLLAVELVDDPGYRFLIAGNGGGGDDDLVPGLDLHLTVGGEGHAVQGGHILALRAGGDDDDLVLGQGLDLVDIHQSSLGDIQIAQLRGHLQDVLHAAAGDGHLAAVPCGDGEHGLNAVHIGGEGGDDDAVSAALEMPIQTLSHQGLRGGIAGALGIGGVHQQGVNALLAQSAETAEIGDAVLAGGIDLEVAGEDHVAHRGLDAEGNGIGDGVVDVDEFHAEAAGLHHVAGLMGDQLGLVQEAVFLQLQLNEPQGQGRGVDGGIDGLQHIGQGADVILVSVGDKEATELLLIFGKVGHIGDHQIHAVHIVLGETETAVDDDHILAIL